MLSLLNPWQWVFVCDDHSDTFIRHPETKRNMKAQRQYHSESSLIGHDHLQKSIPVKLLSAVSAPNLGSNLHPLLDDRDEKYPSRYSEILLASETLENIVMQGTLIGATVRSRISSSTADACRKMNTRALKLVYGSMKCNQNDLY